MLRAFAAVFLLFFSSLAFAGTPDADAKAAATKAAAAWLALVDKGDYVGSWEASATPMKTGVTSEEWDRALKSVRTPLGEVALRRLKVATYSTTLPGAPDGQYVTLVYRTRFAQKKAAIETITPMLDADGTWKVAGYFIK